MLVTLHAAAIIIQ
jgi:hypothetical protein